jgi:hypothetical protein
MRQKLRGPVRHRKPTAQPGSPPGPAEWLLVNETGWGLPHSWIVLLAALVIGGRVLAGLADRAWARVNRRSSTGRA